MLSLDLFRKKSSSPEQYIGKVRSEEGNGGISKNKDGVVVSDDLNDNIEKSFDLFFKSARHKQLIVG